MKPLLIAILILGCALPAWAQRPRKGVAAKYSAQEVALLDGIDQDEIVALGDKILFTARRTGDFELFVSDGTTKGTRLLANIHPERSSRPSQLTVAGKYVFFVADDGFGGPELWRSDGTTDGTRLVRDINSGPRGSYPRRMLALGDILLFVADDGWHGAELWRSDGTEEGTVLLYDIYLGRHSGDPGRAVIGEGTVYFAATDPLYGRELWRSDGTERGTKKIIDAFANGPQAPENLEVAGGQLFFSAVTLPYGRELWVSNGSAEGTFQVRDINGGPLGSDPGLMHASGALVYFSADDGNLGRELWSSDGTEFGTRQVSDINRGTGGSFPSDFIELDNTTLFLATNHRGRELWSTDGTDLGTRLVSDINSGPADAFGSEGFLSFLRVENGTLLMANDGTYGSALWFTDGTKRGTYMVADINAFGDARGVFGEERYLGFAAIGDRVFLGVDTGHGPSLWEASRRIKPRPN